MPLTLRQTKGSALTHAEMDANWSHVSDYTNLTNKPTIEGPIVMAYHSVKQNLSTGATAIGYTTTTVNTNSYYDTSTALFTPLVPGYYQVNLTMAPELISGTPEAIFQLALYKNGTIIAISPTCTVTSTTPILSNNNISVIVYLNGTSDYLAVGYISTIVSGAWRTAVNGVTCYFQAAWIRS